jgi:ATP-dependent helicase Lhr and Lhr-like helicase
VTPGAIFASSDDSADLLPVEFRQWFASRGWSPRAHQLALLEKARDDRSALLIAPTGAGKTLAGFLPTLVELSSSPPPLWGRSTPAGRRERGQREAASLDYPPPQPSPTRGEGAKLSAADKANSVRNTFISTGRGVQKSRGLHTLYISPLKALAVDIARNLETPIAEMSLPIKVDAIRRISCSPRPSSSRFCSRRTMPLICFPR